jgi:hypothetical protein
MAISLGMGIALSIGEAVLSSSPRKSIIKILRLIGGSGLTIGSLNFAELVKSLQVIAVSTGKRQGMSIGEMIIGVIGMQIFGIGSKRGWFK